MSAQRQQLTDAQADLFETLDDVAEHVSWEFEPNDYQGVSTIGFAHIERIDGRSSFVQRAKSLADSDAVSWVTSTPRNGITIEIEIGGLELRLAPSHRSGYRLSISNVSDIMEGPAHQRLDVRERLHRLVLDRLKYNGYCNGARVYGRVD